MSRWWFEGDLPGEDGREKEEIKQQQQPPKDVSTDQLSPLGGKDRQTNVE
jgi:hypothetical protein